MGGVSGRCFPASLAPLPLLCSALQFDSRQNQEGEGSLHQAEESKPQWRQGQWSMITWGVISVLGIGWDQVWLTQGLPWPVDPFLPTAVLALPFLRPAPLLIGVLRDSRDNDSVFQAEGGSG